jgi:hypothetical protein
VPASSIIDAAVLTAHGSAWGKPSSAARVYSSCVRRASLPANREESSKKTSFAPHLSISFSTAAMSIFPEDPWAEIQEMRRKMQWANSPAMKVVFAFIDLRKREFVKGALDSSVDASASVAAFREAVDNGRRGRQAVDVLREAVQRATFSFFGNAIDDDQVDLLPSSQLAGHLAYLITSALEIGALPRAGGRLTSCAITAFHKKSPGQAIVGPYLETFKWFVGWLESLGIDKPWSWGPRLPSLNGKDEPSSYCPMAAACSFGEVEVVRYLASLGADVGQFDEGMPTASPAPLAFLAAPPAFLALVELGLDLDGRFANDIDGEEVADPAARLPLMFPLVKLLDASLPKEDAEKERVLQQRRDLILFCVKKCPAVLEQKQLIMEERKGLLSFMANVVQAGDAPLLKALMAGGLKFSCTHTVGDNRRPSELPTLVMALHYPSEAIVTTLLVAGILKDWETNYREAAQSAMAGALALHGHVVAGAGAHAEIHSSPALSTRILKMVLPRFSRLNNFQGVNQLFARLTENASNGLLTEEGVMTALRLFQPYCDLTKPEPGLPGINLVHHGAKMGFPEVIRFAVKTLGLSTESVFDYPETNDRLTPLALAIQYGKTKAALTLVEECGANAFVPGVDCLYQPLNLAVFFGLLAADQEELLSVIRGLTTRYKDCLNPAFYAKSKAVGVVAGPIAYFITTCAEPSRSRDLRPLELFLSPSLDYVTEAINRMAIVATPQTKLVCGNAAQIAAHFKAWPAVILLLKQGSVTVTTRMEGSRMPDGSSVPAHVQRLPSVVDSIRMNKCSDRLVVSLVEAACAKEAEARSSAGTAASGATTSNAFEDPTKKVLTAAEEKKKAKKREQKKKAKAKKRAAAGAGKVDDGGADSDSDSSGEDEEEAGMNEEERMLARAPTFDLEKEKAARKARAEAEAVTESK